MQPEYVVLATQFDVTFVQDLFAKQITRLRLKKSVK